MTTPTATSVPPRSWTCSGSRTKQLRLAKKKKLVAVALRKACCAAEIVRRISSAYAR
jgi:hypothetical protein